MMLSLSRRFIFRPSHQADRSQILSKPFCLSSVDLRDTLPVPVPCSMLSHFSNTKRYARIIVLSSNGKCLNYNARNNLLLKSALGSNVHTLTLQRLCQIQNNKDSQVPPETSHNLVFTRRGHLLSQHAQTCIQPLSHRSGGSYMTCQVTPTRRLSLPKLIYNASPSPWQPYLQLIRFDKPTGTWLLYWPCTWSIALAAQPGCWPDVYMLALFGAGAFFMRGAGCIINDMWDKDFDIKVERTKDRPLACDRISYPQALAFLASQLSISLAILLQLNLYSIGLGVASLSLVITYPAFKRFTYWPQIVLGLALNFGTLLAWAAIRGSCDWSVCIPLYFMCHMWTMVYDTIYAHQDKSDDILVGVKSTALRFGENTKPWLTGFTTAMAGGLLCVGHMTDMTWPYYTGATLTIASILAQLYRLDIDNPHACGDAFQFHFYIGLLMFVSITLANLAKPKTEEEKSSKTEIS